MLLILNRNNAISLIRTNSLIGTNSFLCGTGLFGLARMYCILFIFQVIASFMQIIFPRATPIANPYCSHSFFDPLWKKVTFDNPNLWNIYFLFEQRCTYFLMALTIILFSPLKRSTYLLLLIELTD